MRKILAKSLLVSIIMTSVQWPFGGIDNPVKVRAEVEDTSFEVDDIWIAATESNAIDRELVDDVWTVATESDAIDRELVDDIWTVATESNAMDVELATMSNGSLLDLQMESVNVFEFGDGSKENPYQVSTVEQLDAVRDDLNAYYLQTADIDLSGIEWMPIGLNNGDLPEERFGGTYDGNGFSISNLTITQWNGDTCYGLFKTVNGEVKNLAIDNCLIDLKGTQERIYIGGITAILYEGGKISNCNTSGKIVFDGWDLYYTSVGGIIGADNASGCTECENQIDIDICVNNSGNMSVAVGGIEGSGHTVQDCINRGTINVTGTDYVSCGGIIGSGRRIYNCVNYGDISGRILKWRLIGNTNHCCVGGIGGLLVTYVSCIDSCVNFGNITSLSDSSPNNAAGGILGDNDPRIHVNNCYNVGKEIILMGRNEKDELEYVNYGA